jgi:uncharacterized protein YraI
MKNYRLLTIVLIASLMLACNVSALTTPPTPIVVEVTRLVPQDTPLPAATEAPTALPAPTDVLVTPTDVPTPTASVPLVTPLKDPVNCRFGPSVNYAQVYALSVGASAQVIGKSADGAWWQVQIPENSQACWVADSVVVSSGDLSGIVIVAAPMAFVTDVKVQVKPESINLGLGCVGPYPTYSIKGTISVNGPLDVKWHIETQQDGSVSEHKLSFSKFGSQDISYDYVPSSWKKGNFWVHLVITSPQSMLSEATYQVKCE